jgi:D-glycero-D-manno-heptose 1,7-bisphosphate phosphatase
VAVNAVVDGTGERWPVTTRPRRAVFVDKDGTLVEDAPYNVDPGRIRLMRGAASGLSRLHRAGYALVVVSNQPGVAHGFFQPEALRPVEARIRQLLARTGVPLAAFRFCPHHPGGSIGEYTHRCDCRKPRPGLLLRSCRDLALDPRASWMVGDILDDVEAGHRAGCRTILIDNGHETEWVPGPLRVPDHVVEDLDGAARTIVSVDRGRSGTVSNPRTHQR